MDTNQIINKLKLLCFKEYEAKVFIVLLKGIPMSATEIAKASGIIRNSIYDVLKSFVQKGYCNEIETNTILKYQIIDPLIIMDKLENEFHQNLKQNIAHLKDTFTDLQSIYKKDIESAEAVDTNISLIRGFNKHRIAKYLELFKDSVEEVLGMYRLKGVVTTELNKVAEKFIQNGGKIRSIYQTNLDFRIVKNGKQIAASKQDLIEVCEFFESNGEVVRITDMMVPNLSIFDKSNVFINLTGEKSIPKHKQADIIIKNPEFAKNMCDLFQYYWENAYTIQEYKNKE